jgi:hypothetical protein
LKRAYNNTLAAGKPRGVAVLQELNELWSRESQLKKKARGDTFAPENK